MLRVEAPGILLRIKGQSVGHVCKMAGRSIYRDEFMWRWNPPFVSILISAQQPSVDRHVVHRELNIQRLRAGNKSHLEATVAVQSPGAKH